MWTGSALECNIPTFFQGSNITPEIWPQLKSIDQVFFLSILSDEGAGPSEEKAEGGEGDEEEEEDEGEDDGDEDKAEGGEETKVRQCWWKW